MLDVDSRISNYINNHTKENTGIAKRRRVQKKLTITT